MRDTYHIMVPRTIPVTKPHPKEVRQFRHDKGGRLKRFLGRIKWALWKWWSQPYFEVIDEPMLETISVHSIREAIQLPARAIKDILYRDCRHVILGPRQLHGLKVELIDAYGPFGMDFRLCDGRLDEVVGLKVHVVSWFDGILVLPDLEE